MSSQTNGNVVDQAKISAVSNRLKSKIAANNLTHAFSIKLVSDIEVVHYAAAAGYDAILIDLEHSSFGLDTAKQLSCAALQVNITPVVRVPANSSEWISRALDGGAQAIIVPHVNSAAEAARVVQYARFAPLGERSATSGMPILRYASIPAKIANQVANEETLVICMIETERAVEIADEIAAVPGVDMLLIGSSDLTADMGIPGDFDNPKLEDAYAKVSAAATKASEDRSKPISRHWSSRPDLIEKFATKFKNARFSMSGADNAMLLGAMKASLTKFDEISKRIDKATSV